MSRAQPAPNRGNEQQCTQDVGNKTRKYQENPTKHRAEAGAFEMNRPNPVPAEGIAEAIDIAAARPPQDQEAQNGGGEKKANGPKPPDRDGDCDKRGHLRDREQEAAQ